MRPVKRTRTGLSLSQKARAILEQTRRMTALLAQVPTAASCTPELVARAAFSCLHEKPEPLAVVDIGGRNVVGDGWRLEGRREAVQAWLEPHPTQICEDVTALRTIGCRQESLVDAPESLRPTALRSIRTSKSRR